MQKILIILICSIIVSSGCQSFWEGDFIELEGTGEDIRLNCFLNEYDSIITIYLDKSRANYVDTVRLHNANISFLLNGQVINNEPFIAHYDLNGHLENYTAPLAQQFGLFSQKGDELFLEIDIPNFSTVRATQVIPSTIPLDTVGYQPKVSMTELLEERDLYSFTFTDPADEENYYWAELLGEQGFMRSFDPIVDDYGLFTDKEIDGQTYTVSLLGYSHAAAGVPEGFTLIYRLHSITKELYHYMKSYYAQAEANENPFAQPVIINSNIEGGIGAFGVYRTSEMELVIR